MYGAGCTYSPHKHGELILGHCSDSQGGGENPLQAPGDASRPANAPQSFPPMLAKCSHFWGGWRELLTTPLWGIRAVGRLVRHPRLQAVARTNCSGGRCKQPQRLQGGCRVGECIPRVGLWLG